MVFSAGPCEAWQPQDCAAWPAATDAIRDAALMAATEILWERTKKRFGTCTYTLRPCAEDCAGESALAWLYGSWMPTWGMSSGGFGWPYPALIGGTWFNLGCGGSCQGTCSCTELQQVQLPYPVSGIGEVKIDGVVLDVATYRVDDWQWLVRLDGERWPRCQDLELPDTEVGTWSVTATYGEDVPELGRFAVGDLGLQIALACVGSAGCTLPSATVKEIRRQGVTKKFDAGWLAGFDSISSVNVFIETYNPTRSGVATIVDIDGRKTDRRIGT